MWLRATTPPRLRSHRRAPRRCPLRPRPALLRLLTAAAPAAPPLRVARICPPRSGSAGKDRGQQGAAAARRQRRSDRLRSFHPLLRLTSVCPRRRDQVLSPVNRDDVPKVWTGGKAIPAEL